MVVILGPGTGQSISTTAIIPRKIFLTSGSAAATASIKCNGVEIYPIAVGIASQSFNLIISGQEMAFGAQSLPGPITADVTGAGAKLVIEW